MNSYALTTLSIVLQKAVSRRAWWVNWTKLATHSPTSEQVEVKEWRFLWYEAIHLERYGKGRNWELRTLRRHDLSSDGEAPYKSLL